MDDRSCRAEQHVKLEAMLGPPGRWKLRYASTSRWTQLAKAPTAEYRQFAHPLWHLSPAPPILPSPNRLGTHPSSNACSPLDALTNSAKSPRVALLCQILPTPKN